MDGCGHVFGRAADGTSNPIPAWCPACVRRMTVRLEAAELLADEAETAITRGTMTDRLMFAWHAFKHAGEVKP